MSLLGRKLYAAFERKSGKIEYINPNIAPNITEEHLTILREFNPGKSGLMVGNWAVFAGVVKQAERDEIKPIKRSRSIVEILAWCYFNHIIDGATRFTLSAGETNLSDQELRKILGCFNILYPDRLSMASQESFHHGARPQQITLIINVGVDPMAKMNRKGYQRITEQTDALNFSGLHQNLVVTIDQITKNTWHEVSTMHFDGDQSVIDCVLDFMRNHVPGKHSMPKIDILCYSPTRPKGICQRLEHLFEGILETYYRRKHRLETRYILVVGNKYFIFQFRNQQPIVKSVASLSALMRYLSAPQKEFSPIIFDAYAHPRDTLPFLVRKNSPDVVQVFYRKLETKITFYIFDEKGSLITFHESDIQEKPFLRKLYRFFQSIESRRQQACVAGGGVEKVYKVSFYEVVQGDPFAIETRVVSASIEDERYHNIEVIVERSSDDEQHYTIFCDHQEFSEYQYGKGIFKAVAQHILKQRKGQAPYPVTITSLDLASVTQAQESLQTAYYLQQKLALEWQINRTLKESAD
jgi:adenylate cyclase class 1